MYNEAVKIIALNKLTARLSDFREKKIVLTGGCFDIFHYGHYDFLKRSKKEGNVLIVLLESDEFIRKNKKKEPFHNQEERAEILAALDMVDLVVKLPMMKSDLAYDELIKIISPSVIALTQADPKENEKQRQAELVGAKLIKMSLINKFSSTKIRCDYF